MSLIEQNLFGTIDKVQTAIERLRAFQPKDRPYWLAFSGGKDSCVILELAKMSGVNFEAHYSVTSVDPPELVRFIKKQHPEVSIDIPHDKKRKTNIHVVPSQKQSNASDEDYAVLLRKTKRIIWEGDRYHNRSSMG